MVTATWQAHLDGQFPGFLLPHTERCRLTRTAAEAFLEHLGLGGANLPLLRGMSLLAAHDDKLHEFATYWLPELIRSLPSRARVENSEGALRPGDEPKRFEIAVLLILLAGIEQRFAALGEYQTSRDLIAGDRQQVATFTRSNASRVDVAVLPANRVLGARDRGASHYLGSTGRLRPDITVRVQRGEQQVAHTLFEIKLSDDVSYAASGYAEAMVYRHEYAPYLTGWTKAVLVTSQPIQGTPRHEDDVVALAWNELAGSAVLDGCSS